MDNDKLSDIGKALNDLVNAANDGNDFDLSVRDVWYNIDTSVPETPAILIEPQSITRDITNTGHMTTNTFAVSFTVLHSRMGSETDTRTECLKIAEELEEVLHADRRLDGKLIHSFVSSIDLGLATRQKVTLRAARLVWSGFNKTRLPNL